ncbi:MAG: hypothetical protein H6R01_462 [Burkholderiaceae bacterium]|nr:hypothetical protein [Burkholderiaceae bacterium]
MKANFRITYDGPALASSEMDVRDLAPALLSVGDLLEAATKALYGNQITPQVNVKGSFKTGCFGIDFSLATDLLTRIKDIFASEPATAMANAGAILTMLGFVYRSKPGLLSALRWIRGRPITNVEAKGDVAVLHIDGERLQIEIDVLTLLRDVSVRRAFEKVLSPVSQDGIDVFAVGSDSEIVERITKDQVAWFKSPHQTDVVLLDDVRKMAFSIVSLAFKEDNKWRLYDGAATIHASILDADFISRVDRNLVSFAKGDVLVCEVRVQQWQTESGARTEYDVVRVLEHRPSGRQIQLPGL